MCIAVSHPGTSSHRTDLDIELGHTDNGIGYVSDRHWCGVRVEVAMSRGRNWRRPGKDDIVLRRRKGQR